MSTRPSAAPVRSRLDKVLRVGFRLRRAQAADDMPHLASLSLTSKRTAPIMANEDEEIKWPLFQAVDRDDVRAARELLYDGAYVHIFRKDKLGRLESPLTAAIQRENLDMVNLLVRHGAQWFEQHFKFGIFFVDNDSHETILPFLLYDTIKVNQKDSDGITILMAALYYDACGLAKRLLEDGANVNIKNNGNETALFYATKWDSEECNEVLRMLLRKGAEVNVQSRDGMTALHFAVLDRNERAFHILLKEQADISLVNDDNETILQYIERMIDYFDEQGVDPIGWADLRRMKFFLENDYRQVM
tara:strand:- start:963 stop:1871 length:909 start_codon:yes stop_codon:yes gene_type:complete